MNLIGSFLTPVSIGYISDKTDLRFALLFLPLMLIVATVLFIFAKKQYFKDLEIIKNSPTE
ncbi:MAG: hypothetical protein IPO21_18330 [Bacteroidales bacterium]|nr:hypothetical protein [Bacteroidales bacterium]